MAGVMTLLHMAGYARLVQTANSFYIRAAIHIVYCLHIPPQPAASFLVGIGSCADIAVVRSPQAILLHPRRLYQEEDALGDGHMKQIIVSLPFRPPPAKPPLG